MANNTNGLDNAKQYIFTGAGLAKLASATITKITGITEDSKKKIQIYRGDGTSTEKIEVGSNIIFKQLNGNDLAVSTTTQANRERGTFRVTVDGSTYDVPIVIKNWTPTTVNSNTLGTTTDIWGGLYARGAVFGRAADEENNITAINATNVRPATDNTGNLGTSSIRWAYVYATNGNFTNLTATNVQPAINNTGNLGTSSIRWANVYATNGDFTNLTATNGNFTNLTVNGNNITSLVPSSKGNTSQFWRGGGSNNPSWSNELEGSFTLTANKSAYLKIGAYGGDYGTTGTADLWYNGSNSDVGNYKATTLYCNKNFSATKVYNAVFNDYAEYRTTINLTPGHVVIDQDNGSLICTSARLQPGAQVISDTFGHAMGQTFEATTPIAVAGRVLVYTYQPRENYHAGMAVCSAPDGTVDIMTREEIRDYPDCIVGIVSEIPVYETWGSDNVKVDGRIWVRIK